MVWALLLQGAVIASPSAPYRMGEVWNIFTVVWGDTGIELFDLLPNHQLPLPSSLAGTATADASALRGGPLGGAAILFRLRAPPFPAGLRNGPPMVASFTSTASPILPHDDLHSQFRERLVSSWWVWHVVSRSTASRVA